MRNHRVGSISAFAAAGLAIALMSVPVAGQGPSAPKATAAATWTTPHTPWGDPDMREYFAKQTVPENIQTVLKSYGPDAIDDIVEVWSINPKGVRQDKIPPDMRPITTPELGKMFVELKVSNILQHARRLGLTR